MERMPIESSLIRAVAYDPTASVLEVEFTGEGHVYEYYDVPYSVFEELLHEESKGRYFNEHVKDLYAAERIA